MPDVSKIEFGLSATDRASPVFKAVENALGHLGGTFQTVLGGLGVGIGAGSVATLLADILSQISEAEQASNRLTAVMRNTGTVSRQELEGVSAALSSSTKFDNTSIVKAESEILIFGNITGKTFQDVLKISADVASFMHTDLPAAAHDVAQAVAEPESAFKLLKSAGVILTDQQKDQIKHMGALGDKAGQQEVLVQKLKSAYDGMAETMNTGLVGASASLNKSWNDLLETLGRTPAVTNTAEGGLSGLRILIDGLKAGVDKLSGIGGTDPWAGLRAKLAEQKGGSGPLGLSPDFIKQVQGLSLPGPTVGIETPEETYARQKIERQTAAAEAVITFGLQRDRLAAEQKLLDDKHGEGLISIEDYYAQRRDLVERGLKAETAAVAQGIAAQQAIKANATTPEAVAGADIAISGLRAQGARAAIGASTANDLLVAQKRRAELAESVAAARTLGESYTQAGDRINASDQALADFNETMSQNSQDLQFQTDLLGKSAQEQALLTAQRNVDLQTLQSAKNINAENVSQMEALYRAAEASKKELKELYDANYAAARSWKTGLTEGINEYIDAVTNSAAQSKKVAVDMFQGMEDALVSFVRTGKVDFSSLADSIITDLIRIQVQRNIMAPLVGTSSSPGILSQGLSALGGWLFGGSSLPTSVPFDPMSGGGDFPQYAAGTPYVPKTGLALLHQGEAVIPATQNRGGGSISVVNNNYIDSRSDRAVILAAMEDTRRRTISSIADLAQRGGAFATAIRGS